jgi:toxin ParE1/3/4
VKIVWSPLAVERLENVFEYIAQDNSIAAQTMVERVFKKVESLETNPERGRKVPEVKREDIREVFESGFRIIYKVEQKRIVILSIRNFKQLLPEKDLE